MKLTIWIIFFVTLISLIITEITLNCDFAIKTWPRIEPNIFTCTVTNTEIFTDDRPFVTQITGSNHEVGGLQIKSATNLKYLPQNVEKFFGNLFYLSFFGSGICEIRQHDLKVYPKLKYLYLTKNQLESIGNGLFKYNLDLELINLDFNKIVFIESQTFDNLHKLRYLDLGNNICELDPCFGDDKSKVLRVIEAIKSSIDCQSSVKLVAQAIDRAEAKINKKVDQKLTSRDNKYETLTKYLMIGFSCITVALFIILIVILGLICFMRKDVITNDIPMNDNYDVNSFDNTMYDNIRLDDGNNKRRVKCTVR